MRSLVSATCLLAGLLSLMPDVEGSQVDACAVSSSGELAIADVYHMQSDVLTENREFYVSLPSGYRESMDDYPVLYLLDADQNMEHAVASARLLAAWRGLPELIIVGIPSTHRLRDYTPSKVQTYSDQSGGGDAFMAFITQELMPHIDAAYRTHPFRILSGHSLSGLIAADDLLQGSSSFNAYIITAPSLWWDDFHILDVAEETFRSQQQRDDTAAFFGIGEFDGSGMKQELLRFVGAIESSGIEGIRYAHSEYPGEGHMSAPMSVTYDGLLHVFADLPYDRSRWDRLTEASFRAHEQRMLDKYGQTATQTAETYVALANFLLEQRDFEGAATVFAANARVYADFAPSHEWLANAYVLAGDPVNARESYQTAYDLTVNSVTGQGNAYRYTEQLALLDNSVNLGSDELESLVGCYRSGDERYAVYMDKGKLYGQHGDIREFELFAKSASEFFMRVPPGHQFSFRDEAGRMSLIVEAYGEPVEFLADHDNCLTEIE